MKTIILLLLVLFSSCQNNPTAPKIAAQVRRIWSVKFSTCYCQFYDIMKVENATDAVACEIFFKDHFPDRPTLENHLYCDDLVGFSAKAWAKYITPFGREAKRYAEDTCN